MKHEILALNLSESVSSELKRFLERVPNVVLIEKESGSIENDFFQSEKPSLILLAGSNSLKISRTLKDNPAAKDITTLLIRDSSEFRDEPDQILYDSIDGFVRYPFDELELASQIRLVLQLSKSKTEHEILRKQWESFREKANEVKGIFNSIPDNIFTIDTEQRNTGVYGSWADKHKLPHDYFLHKKPREILDSDSAALHEIANSKALAGQKVKYEWSLKTEQGNIYYQTFLSPIRDDNDVIKGAVGISRDITERKEVEIKQEVLYNISGALNRMSDIASFCQVIRHDLSKAINTDNFFVAFYDKDTDLLSFPYGVDENERLKTVNAKHTLTKKVIESNQPLLLYREDIAKFIEQGKVELVGTPAENWLGVPLTINNEAFGAVVVQSYKSTVKYNERDIKLMAFVAEEIAFAIKHAQTDEDLRLYKERVESLSRKTGTFFWETDQFGMFTYWDPLSVEIIGYEPHDIVGKKYYYDLHTEKAQEETIAKVEEIIEARLKVFNFEAQMIHKNGKLMWFLIHAIPIFDEQGKYMGYRGSYTNITELKQARDDHEELVRIREQYAHSQKIYAIGELTSSIAHEFNNLLMIILNRMDIAIQYLPHDGQFLNVFQEIKEATEKSASLTRQLLDFSRKQKRESKITDLNTAIDKVIKLLKGVISSRIELKWNTECDACKVLISETDVSQIVMNLCINARDAIDGVGSIEVSLQFSDIEDKNYILLTVKDTGSGMDKDLQSKIFDAYFSTKEPGKGTGLGLATVKRIVDSVGGHIEIESEVGIGTCFKIYLPLFSQDEMINNDLTDDFPNDLQEKTRKINFITRNKVILVVDDDEAMLEVISLMLEALDYQTITFNKPDTALDYVLNNTSKVDLVMVDLHMPIMSGYDLVKKIKEHDENQKVVLMSGSIGGIALESIPLRFNPLTKPFNMKDLDAKLEEIFSIDEKKEAI